MVSDIVMVSSVSWSRMAINMKFLIIGSITVILGKLKDLMSTIPSVSMVMSERFTKMARKRASGKVVILCWLELMTIPFLVMILTTQLTCVYGVHCLLVSLTSAHSIKVITSRLWKREKRLSTLLPCSIPMIPLILVRNCVWSNNTCSSVLPFKTCSVVSRRKKETGRNCLKRLLSSWMTPILLLLLLNCLEFSLISRIWKSNTLGILSTEVSHTLITLFFLKPLRSGVLICSEISFLVIWKSSTLSISSSSKRCLRNSLTITIVSHHSLSLKRAILRRSVWATFLSLVLMLWMVLLKSTQSSWPLCYSKTSMNLDLRNSRIRLMVWLLEDGLDVAMINLLNSILKVWEAAIGLLIWHKSSN